MTEIKEVIQADLLKTIISAMLNIDEKTIESIEPYNNPLRKDTSFLVHKKWTVEDKIFTQIIEVGIKVVPLTQGPKECLNDIYMD